jgi:hypothetical protein
MQNLSFISFSPLLSSSLLSSPLLSSSLLSSPLLSSPLPLLFLFPQTRTIQAGSTLPCAGSVSSSIFGGTLTLPAKLTLPVLVLVMVLVLSLSTFGCMGVRLPGLLLLLLLLLPLLCWGVLSPLPAAVALPLLPWRGDAEPDDLRGETRPFCWVVSLMVRQQIQIVSNERSPAWPTSARSYCIGHDCHLVLSAIQA